LFEFDNTILGYILRSFLIFIVIRRYLIVCTIRQLSKSLACVYLQIQVHIWVVPSISLIT